MNRTATHEQGAERFGLPFRAARDRLADIATVVEHLRELYGDVHTPVLLAGR